MRRGAQRRRSSPALEIGGAHLAVGEELAPGAGERDLPGLHDIAAMGEPQGMVRVLLDQEHRDLLLLVDLADHFEDLLDDERREAERGLVEQQEARPTHQRAADRQHLLLAAGERAAALALAPLEDGKEREDAAQILGEMRRLRYGSADLQI